MNHVTTLFNSNEFGELRTIIIENEVYFVAKSVATALGYKDTADAIRKHSSVNGQWILYGDLMHKGYTKTKTHTYMTTDGRLECKASTRWTQKGRLMIHEVLKKLGINAVCEEVA